MRTPSRNLASALSNLAGPHAEANVWPMLAYADLALILPSLPRLAMKSYAYWVVDLKYLAANSTPHPRRFLYGLGAPAAGARFTPPGGPAAVNLADEIAIAYDEANPVRAIVRQRQSRSLRPSL